MSRRKKILRVVLIVIVAFFVCEGIAVAVSSYVGARNKEWGLKISVDEVDSLKVTYTMHRENSEIREEIMTGDAFGLQRWTLFGWKNIHYLEGHGFFTAIAYSMEAGRPSRATRTEKRDLEWHFGKLKPGIYRVGKNFSAGSYGEPLIVDGKEVDNNFNLYAPFLILFN